MAGAGSEPIKLKVNETILLQSDDTLELGFAKDGCRAYVPHPPLNHHRDPKIEMFQKHMFLEHLDLTEIHYTFCRQRFMNVK
eukprot:COSAG05_NODE_573_length_8601_cov_58.330981_6_plen_82_part_00